MTLNIFNSLHSRLQFTMKISIEKDLNFLDTNIIIENKRITFDTYHKSNFWQISKFPFKSSTMCHKRSIISMIDQIVRLSHPRFHQKNLIDTIQIFLNNQVILYFLFSPLSIIE